MHTHPLSSYRNSCSDSQEISPSHPIEQDIYMFTILKVPFKSSQHNSASTYNCLAELVANAQILNAHWEDIE